MASTIVFRRGNTFPSQGSGITLAEPVFNTSQNTFHIGLGHGVTAAWVGAPITGLSASIASGEAYKIPTAEAVKNYIGGLCYGNTGAPTITQYVSSFNGLTGAVGGVCAAQANTFTALQSFANGISASGITVNGDMSVTGNFTVSGGVTFTTSETVLIEDNIITLNSNVTGSPSENAGVEIERGTSANVQLLWNESSDKWTFTNDGSTYYDLPTSVVTSFNGTTGAVQGVSAAVAGTGISVSGATGAVTITNTGVQSFNGTTGAVQGVSAAVAGTGISVSGTTGSVTFTNTGVQSFNGSTGAVQGVSAAVAGTGISVSGTTGSVTITNTGVQSFNGTTGAVQGVRYVNGRTGDIVILGGTNIGVSTSGQIVTVNNEGVLSVDGSTGAVNNVARTNTANTFTQLQTFSNVNGISASRVSTKTVELPGNQSNLTITGALFTDSAGIRLYSSDGFGGDYYTTVKGSVLSADRTITFPDTTGTVALTSQLMGAVNGSTAATTAVTSFNGLTGAVTGVSAAVAGTGISVSGATGSVTITNTGVQSFNGTTGAVQGVSSVNGSTGAVTTYAGTTGNIQFRYGSGVTANNTFTLSRGDEYTGEETEWFTISGYTYAGGGGAVIVGNVESKGIRINRSYGQSGLDEGGGVAIEALGIFNDGEQTYGSNLFLTTPSTDQNAEIIIAPQDTACFSYTPTNVFSLVPFNAQAGANFSGTITVNSARLGKTGSNLVFGDGCGNSITTGINNTLIGFESGDLISSGQQNTTVGYQALTEGTTGGSNTAVGFWALRNTTTGNNNSAVGTRALRSNTTGNDNIGIGIYALELNQTGIRNIAIGAFALSEGATSAANNIGIGYAALLKNTTGSENVGIGTDSLRNNTTAKNNAGIGYQSLYSATSGGSNVGVGTSTMYRLTTGTNNVAIGYQALFGSASVTSTANVAIGYNSMVSNTIGSYNAGIGLASLYSLTTGQQNIAVGGEALYAITNASNNTAVGQVALRYATQGSDNTAIGINAGSFKTASNTNLTAIGSYNVFIGSGARASGDNNNNEVVIGGQNPLGLGSNTTVIGNSSTVGNRIFGVNSTGQVAPTVASAATIAPTTSIVFVSGTTQINTITAPSTIATTGGQITLIPTGLWTTGTTGNIALASTAVVSRALIMTYDAGTAKWYPSY